MGQSKDLVSKDNKAKDFFYENRNGDSYYMLHCLQASL